MHDRTTALIVIVRVPVVWAYASYTIVIIAINEQGLDLLYNILADMPDQISLMNHQIFPRLLIIDIISLHFNTDFHLYSINADANIILTTTIVLSSASSYSCSTGVALVY